MKRSWEIFSFLIMTILLCGCQGYSDGRMLKKFISRFNAGEYASAATYIYPADRMHVAFFAKEVKTLAPNAFIKLKDYKTEGKGENREIVATLKWDNVTPALRNYFTEIGHPLDKDGMQTVKLKIRDTADGETMSFIWGIPEVLSDNLWIASVVKKDGKPVEKTFLYKQPGSKDKKSGVMDHDLIVGQEDDSGWMPVYQVDKEGKIITSYIVNSKGLKLDRTAYFSLGIFDSISVILALVIIIVIIVPLFYVKAIIEIFSNNLIVGPIVIIVLLFAILYVVYQLLEKILFELFIINLPY